MAADLCVSLVQTRSLHRAFRDLPCRLYRADPLWVAPLRSVEDQRRCPEHNSSLRRRWCRRYVVQRKGQVVGRIAAIIDEDFCRRWVSDAGFFGFFECTDDPEAAGALLAAVEESLRQQNKTRLLGPVNLTTHDEVGLLVAGNDSPPTVLSPYNPLYYERLLVQFGFTPHADYHSYRWSPEQVPAPAVQRLLRWRSARGSACSALTIRSSRRDRWAEDLRVLFALYNASFAEVWGFVPLTWEEFQERAASFRPFYEPDFVLIAEQQARPVGFALVLPDVNEALAWARGWPGPLFWVRLALAVRRIRRARFILLGVLPEATGAGIAALLAQEAAEIARRRGIRPAELSLVHSANSRVRHVIDAFGAEKARTYRLFEKVIPGATRGSPALPL